jgi:transposase
MASMAHCHPERHVVVGIDTHKHVHVAVALDVLGAHVGSLTVPADSPGYCSLAEWMVGLGHVHACGIEGTGSFGAGLASYLRRRGIRIVEVNRPDRRVRRQRGKTDPVDAENAARAVLGGIATSVPKQAAGTVEMLRQLKVARDTAVKSRTQAMITLKALLITAPADLRELLDGLSERALIDRCAGLRPGPGDDAHRRGQACPAYASPALARADG